MCQKVHFMTVVLFYGYSSMKICTYERRKRMSFWGVVGAIIVAVLILCFV